MVFPIGFSLILVAASVNAGIPLAEKLDFSFEGSQNCENEKWKMRIDNLQIERISRSHMAITGDYCIDVPIDENLSVTTTITKCPSATERTMCEDFPPTDVNDICQRLPKKNESWSDFIEILKDFTPECPVKPGCYHFERYPVDMDHMASMPYMEGHWILKTSGTREGEKVLCVIYEVQFKPAKEKKKKSG